MIRNPEIQFASADAIAAFQQEYLREDYFDLIFYQKNTNYASKKI